MKNNQRAVQERRRNILQMIQDNGEAMVADIAEAFKISEMTVRRDLQYLEDQNLLFRKHGGAGTLEMAREMKLFGESVNLCRDSISRFAARFVNDGDILFINGSRTALNLLRHVENKEILVYTNNGWAVGEKYPEGVKICLTGGELKNHVMVGEYVMRYLLSISVNKIFIGCAAVYDDGEFRYDIPTEIGINESLVSRRGNKIYVLADHSKLKRRVGHENFYGSSTYDRHVTLITDEKADSSIVDKLSSHGMDIITVPLPK